MTLGDGCETLWGYLLSAASPTAPTWTVESSATATVGATGPSEVEFVIGEPLETGTTYALVYAWPATCELEFGQDEDGAPWDAGVGLIDGYHWSGGDLAGAAYTAASVSTAVVSDGVAFPMGLDHSH